MKDEYLLDHTFETVLDEDNNEHEFSGLKFSQLPEWAQDAIKDYSLTIYYFEELSEEERDSMFYRLNNGKPLTAIELTRVRAQSLRVFQDIANHELISLAVTEKGRVSYNHENFAMQMWAINYANPDNKISFETKTFRPLIENADVAEWQVNQLKRAMDILLDIYNSYDQSNRTLKRQSKRIITRTHTVALSYIVIKAINDGVDEEDIKQFVRYFYDTTSAKVSINEDYNTACGGGGLARADKIAVRVNALNESMTLFLEALHSEDLYVSVEDEDIDEDEDEDEIEDEVEDDGIENTGITEDSFSEDDFSELDIESFDASLIDEMMKEAV